MSIGKNLKVSLRKKCLYLELFWFKNYRCAHRNFLKRKKVKQESFNAHFAEANHNGMEDWEVRLIDQTDNVEDLRKRESFWQH